MASFYLYWTQSVEHGWKAMILGIITMTLSSPQIFHVFFIVSVLKILGIDKSKVMVSVCEKIGIEKSINIEKILVLVSFRFLFSSHTVSQEHVMENVPGWNGSWSGSGNGSGNGSWIWGNKYN